jgi:4-amino-4-deoxy-L-arabinose transferase-like glycosyltransferase
MLKRNFLENKKVDRFYVSFTAIGLAVLGQYLLNQRMITLSIILFITAICLIIFSFRDSNNIEFHIPIRKIEIDSRSARTLFAISIGFAIISFILFSRQVSQIIPWIFHILSIIFLISGSIKITRNKFLSTSLFSFWQNSEIFVFIFIIILAVLVRIIRLEQIPFGFWYDEAVNGLNAVRIVQDPNYLPIFLGDTNLPAHFNYLIALSIKIFGESVFSVRFVSAIVGVLTVFVAYYTGSELFNRKMGLMFAFLFAVSRWDINWSRIGMHGVTVPFFELLSIGLLLRAIRTRKVYLYTFTGLSLGLGFLFYFPLRFFPIVIAVFLIFLCLRKREFLKFNWPGLVLIVISALLITLPLIQFTISHPNEFFSRMQTTSIFSNKTFEQAWQSIIQTTREHLLMFNYHGDNNGRHNLSGTPMLDPISGALFILGFAVSIRYIYKPKYFLMLCWFLLMLLPAILSLDFESPQSYRAIGSMPAVYLFAIIPIYLFSELKNDRPDWGKNLLYQSIIITFVLMISVVNISMYFNYQMKSTASWLEFSAKETIIGKKIASLGEDAVFYINSLYFGSPTINFLTPNLNYYHVLETYESLPLRFDNNREALIILDSSQSLLFEQIKNYYPNGDFIPIKEPNGSIILYEIYLKPKEISENQGLTVSYFNNSTFSGQPTIIQTEKFLDRVWENGNPMNFPFGVEWKGLLYAHAFGEYKFIIQNSEMSELILDNNQIVMVGNDFTVSLAKGLHSISFRTIANGGDFEIDWQPPNEEIQPLTSASLYNSSISVNGLFGQYYSNSNWEGTPSYAQIDPYINFYYHNQPIPRPYSVEWTGFINIPDSEEISFRLESVDESMLYIDEQLIVDGGPSSSNIQKNVFLEKGKHPIRVRFSDYTGYTHIYMYWTLPGKEEEIIPPAVLLPN